VEGANEKYLELKQFLYSFLGYYFWKPSSNFDLQKQVKELIIPSEHSNKFNEICNEIVQSCVNKAWKKESPLWEINLININNNDNQKGSVLIFRFHHSLGDGYSILNLLKNELCEDKEQTIKSPLKSTSRKECAQMVWFYTTFLLRVAWESSSILLFSFSLSAWKPKLNSQTWNVFCPPIPIERIRNLKSHFKVSFSSILLSAVSKSIKKTFLHEKVGNDSKQISNLLCMMPVKIMHGRTYKLRNLM